MFLFLSKLLPLFVYPLGLSCICLTVALVLAWRRSKWVIFPISLSLGILLIASNSWLNTTLIRSLEWQYIPQGELPQADAIVLLGGCTKPAQFPRPMPELTDRGDRVLYAAQLYREKKAPLIIAAGGRINWDGNYPPESQDMAELLEFFGVPAEAIIQESKSLNTYQNAVNVKAILEEKKLDRVLLVTSAFHIPRSLAIFKRQNIKAIPAPTDFSFSQTDLEASKDQFSIEGTLIDLIPSIERIDSTSEVIKEYIGFIVYRLRGWL